MSCLLSPGQLKCHSVCMSVIYCPKKDAMFLLKIYAQMKSKSWLDKLDLFFFSWLTPLPYFWKWEVCGDYAVHLSPVSTSNSFSETTAIQWIHILYHILLFCIWFWWLKFLQQSGMIFPFLTHLKPFSRTCFWCHCVPPTLLWIWTLLVQNMEFVIPWPRRTVFFAKTYHIIYILWRNLTIFPLHF